MARRSPASVGRVDGTDDGRPVITLADAEAALGTKALRYGRDDHYDVISAFIKSIRGSDPDAGLYWLARMLEAGEDARFIARRLVILASEDIGMADPQALLVADAAARAVEFVGLPEAQLNLAQAVVHLATAPKSNRPLIGMLGRRASRRARPRRRARCPPTCAMRTTARRASLGHGEGYEYPHDDPRGWVRSAVPAGRGRRPASTTSPPPTATKREIGARMTGLTHDVESEPAGRVDQP